jgi:DNA-binding IclR family transcriptional regulator
VAKAADLPLTTAHRLVGELVEAGMLSRGPHGGLQLGLRLWALAQNTGRQLREIAKPFILDLHTFTREMSQLAVRDEDNALYIERVHGSSRVPRASRVGGRLPLHTTAVGKVILAFDEPWVREAYLSRPLQRRTAHTVVDPRQLSEELDEIAESGYATTHEEVRLGSASLAVPVWHTGRLGCSIGIVVTSEKNSSMLKHLAALRGISKQIERATAHVPLTTLLGEVKAPHAKKHQSRLQPVSEAENADSARCDSNPEV